MDEMYIFQIDFATPEYDEAVKLRYEVLRRPLGLQYTVEQLEQEWNQYHLVLCNPEMVQLGYLNLTHIDEKEIQMRQVAVSESAQKKGIGTALVRYSEQFAREKGYERMMLHARETAISFYEKLGYTPDSEPFIEVGIPHKLMNKSL